MFLFSDLYGLYVRLDKHQIKGILPFFLCWYQNPWDDLLEMCILDNMIIYVY